MCKSKLTSNGIRVTMLMLAGLMLLVCCGCSSSSGGVPDQQAQLIVEDWFYERGMQSGDLNSYSFSVEHHTENKTHTDAAVIHLTVEYNYATEKTSVPVFYTYDRASDLWSLTRKGEWSESEYTFNERELKGSWHIEQFNDTFNINIKGISGNKIDVEYDVSLRAYGGLYYGDIYFGLEGEEKCELKGCYFRIPIELPTDFYCDKGGFDFSEDTEISVYIDPQLGCSSALVYGSLKYSPS